MIPTAMRPPTIAAVIPARAITGRQSLAAVRRAGARRWQSQYIHQEEEPAKYQRVRFVKPRFFSMQRFGRLVVYTATFGAMGWSIWRRLDIEIETTDDAEQEDPLNPKASKRLNDEELTDEDFEADEDSLFIPITWPRKMSRTFYKGTDPEWEEFVKVGKDPERHKKIHRELASLFGALPKRHPGLQRQLGPNVKVGKFWLDTTFPDGPPPEFSRWGIEVADQYIAWSRQVIQEEDRDRLARILWPTAMLSSLYATAKVWLMIEYRQLTQALGFKNRDINAPEERIRRAMEMRRSADKVDRISTEPGVVADQTAAKSVASDQSKTQQALWPVPPVTMRSDESDQDHLLDTIKVAMAFHTLTKTLRKNSNKHLEPPRGTFIVHGMVELRGERGRMVFDVVALYDPKENKYVRLDASPRYFKKAKQAPKG